MAALPRLRVPMEVPMSRLVVFDFDGTMTDAEAEGRPFREGYLEDLATLTGWTMEQVRNAADRIEQAVLADSGAHGWRHQGRIVAPAAVDPYLRMMPVARWILREAGWFPPDSNEPEGGENDRVGRLLNGVLFKYNYLKTDTVFRPGARELLAALEGRCAVVTNSLTGPVQDKIRRLGGNPPSLDWLVERVFGGARKYVVVDGSIEGPPTELYIDGLDRPVLLHRPHYFAVLDRLRQEAGAEWAELTVVGDIFELDLALPLVLGARVGLMANAFTPAYERRFLTAHPRGAVLADLGEAAAFVGA